MHLSSILSVLAGAVAVAKTAAVPPSSSKSSSTAGVEALVRRRLPQHTEQFQFSLDERQLRRSADLGGEKDENDSYMVTSTADGKIHVQGNSPSALLSGLHTYLSEIAHVDVWWYIGSQLDHAPNELPKLSEPLKGSSIVPYRYHFNTVTTSYTSAFWSWEDWELQLDWMALRGVNIALAWIGIEKIFIEVFQEIGLTDAEVATFLSGPAFLAWNHFGNIQGSWGGDLPHAWVDDQFELQKKIVARMVELGITPILPAFPGYVPKAITRVFPDAKVSTGTVWNKFATKYTADTFVDPFDPIFEKLQKSFIEKQTEAYGNVTNFYTLDQYNENDPPSGDLGFLRNISSNTWKTLKSASPQSIWVMQGWLFTANRAFWSNERIEAFLGGVTDNSDMLILDLASEALPQWQRTSSYYGKPWVWCQIHDYGGNMGLYGQVQNITINPIEAVAKSDSLVGFGLSMEGQEGNEIMYDLLLSQGWSSDPIDTESYFHKWVAARYTLGDKSKGSDLLYNAWEMLRTTVFNNINLTSNAVPKSIIELIPSTSGLVNRTGHHATQITYNPATMVEGWNALYKAGLEDPSLFDNPSYTYDLVDWTRQVLVNAFIPMYQRLVTIYTESKSPKCRKGALKKQGQKLFNLLKSLDLVLSTDKNFRLSTWISAARKSAGSDTELADFFEYEARNQITLWGPNGEISDYASKSWSGLVSTYYLPRWEKFVDYLVETDPSAYNQTAFAADLLEWEKDWSSKTSSQQASEAAVDPVQDVLPKVIQNWHTVFN